MTFPFFLLSRFFVFLLFAEKNLIKEHKLARRPDRHADHAAQRAFRTGRDQVLRKG